MVEFLSPFRQFGEWFELAREKNPGGGYDHTTFTLSTVLDGYASSSRVVLLKSFDERGFVFFTNRRGGKGAQMVANNNVSMCFYWYYLGRQVRVEGSVFEIGAGASDEYFRSRDYEKKVGSVVSQQSRPVESYERFIEEYNDKLKEFKDKGVEDVPRPDYWVGFVVVPRMIEFWEDKPYRLHKRVRYRLDGVDGKSWSEVCLYP